MKVRGIIHSNKKEYKYIVITERDLIYIDLTSPRGVKV